MSFLDKLYDEKMKRVQNIGMVSLPSPFKFPRPYTFEDNENIEIVLSSLDLLEKDEKLIAIHSIVQEIERLGDGAHGDVYHSKTGPFILKVTQVKDREHFAEFFQEYLNGLGANYLARDIPNFSYVYTIFDCSNPKKKGWCLKHERNPYIVMENIENSKSLGHYSKLMNLKDLVPLCIEVSMAMAMAYEKLRYVHNDFHFDNILIQDREVKTKYTVGGKVYNYINKKTARFIDYGMSVFNGETPEFIDEYYWKYKDMTDPVQSRDIGVFLNEIIRCTINSHAYQFFRQLHKEMTGVDVSWHTDWRRHGNKYYPPLGKVQVTSWYPTNMTWVKMVESMMKIAESMNLDLTENFVEELHDDIPRKYPEFRHNFSSLFTGMDVIDEWTDIDYATSFGITFDNLLAYHKSGNKKARPLADKMVRLVRDKTTENMKYLSQALEIAERKLNEI